MKLFKNYKAIVYVPNPYALLQYYLLSPYQEDDTLFLFPEEFPRSIVLHIPGAKVLTEKKPGCYISVLFVYWLAISNHNRPIYLTSWSVYSNLFHKLFKQLNHLEDGTGSYEVDLHPEEQKMRKARTWWRRLILGDYYPWYGLAENVEYIYLTGILPIPNVLAKKTKIINLELLWKEKDTILKKRILDIFMPEDLDFSLINSCDILLLTQPFSECSNSNFTESDKIEVYRRLLEGYDESKILIKTHRKEKTDYTSYFPLAKVINTPCPMELLTLLNITFNKAVTVNSTAIYSMSNSVEKIIAGYNVTPALIEEAKRCGFDIDISVRLDNKQLNN